MPSQCSIVGQAPAMLANDRYCCEKYKKSGSRQKTNQPPECNIIDDVIVGGVPREDGQGVPFDFSLANNGPSSIVLLRLILLIVSSLMSARARVNVAIVGSERGAVQ